MTTDSEDGNVPATATNAELDTTTPTTEEVSEVAGAKEKEENAPTVLEDNEKAAANDETPTPPEAAITPPQEEDNNNTQEESSPQVTKEVETNLPTVSVETSPPGAAAANDTSPSSTLPTPVSPEIEAEETDDANAVSVKESVDEDGVDHDDDAGAEEEKEDESSTTKTKKKQPLPPIHDMKPGDHVIRWEMLPIAWPIQIHGIVLTVSPECVVLVDFGLTAMEGTPEGAVPTGGGEEVASPAIDKTGDDDKDAATIDTTDGSTSPTKEKKKSKFFSSDPKEISESMQKSFQRLYPKREKQRLNVTVIDDANELKKWKRVNYDRSLFGFGGPNQQDDDEEDPSKKKSMKNWFSSKLRSKKGDEDGKTDASNNPEEGTDGAEETSTNSTVRGWFKKSSVSSSSEQNRDVSDNKEDGTTTTTASVASSVSSTSKAMASSIVKTMQQQRPGWIVPKAKSTDTTTEDGDKNPDSKSASSSSSGTKQLSSWLPKFSSSTSSRSTPDEGVTAEEEKTTTEATSASDTAPDSTDTEETSAIEKASMNPAMAKLLEEKKEAASPKGKVSFRDRLFKPKEGSGITPGEADDGEEATDEKKPKKKKLDLPKADPPKLVLARTRWLLKYGEAILPPYHAFHSNSECIAVFCKTGYWSNLQADVFLHSTAIGNAKSMGLATVGVAASAPLLAPVIAVAGIGLVAAPWMVLHSSKNKAQKATQSLTDSFWEQAEHEVFVECIEHWSKLDKYYAALAKKKEQEEAKEKNGSSSAEEVLTSPSGTEVDSDKQNSVDEKKDLKPSILQV